MAAVVEQDQLKLMLESVEGLIRTTIAPRAREMDETDKFPRDVYAAMAELGLFGVWVPEEHGGVNADLKVALLLVERIARVSGACSLIFANCSDAVGPLLLGASEEIKREYLPRIASGDVIPCFALTEPDAGSDASAIRSRARKDGGDYLISGRKLYCTNGSVGDIFVIFAKTGERDDGKPEISAFLVERDTKGFEIGRDEDLIGLRGCPATELTLEDVRLPVSARIGAEGEGLRMALASLDESRLNASAMSLGVGRGAIEIAIAYAREREQFGRPIIEHQGLAFLLAEVVTELNAAWATLGRSIDAIEHSQDGWASALVAMTKLFAADVGMRATIEAVQVLGGYGLAKDFVVERMMRDAKAFQIFDGTSQIQKLIIGRYLQRGGTPFPSRW